MQKKIQLFFAQKPVYTHLKQCLSDIWSPIHEKVKQQHWAQLKESVAYKTEVCSTLTFLQPCKFKRAVCIVFCFRNSCKEGNTLLRQVDVKKLRSIIEFVFLDFIL